MAVAKNVESTITTTITAVVKNLKIETIADRILRPQDAAILIEMIIVKAVTTTTTIPIVMNHVLTHRSDSNNDKEIILVITKNIADTTIVNIHEIIRPTDRTGNEIRHHAGNPIIRLHDNIETKADIWSTTLVLSRHIVVHHHARIVKIPATKISNWKRKIKLAYNNGTNKLKDNASNGPMYKPNYRKLNADNYNADTNNFVAPIVITIYGHTEYQM